MYIVIHVDELESLSGKFAQRPLSYIVRNKPAKEQLIQEVITSPFELLQNILAPFVQELRGLVAADRSDENKAEETVVERDDFNMLLGLPSLPTSLSLFLSPYSLDLDPSRLIHMCCVLSALN